MYGLYLHAMARLQPVMWGASILTLKPYLATSFRYNDFSQERIGGACTGERMWASLSKSRTIGTRKTCSTIARASPVTMPPAAPTKTHATLKDRKKKKLNVGKHPSASPSNCSQNTVVCRLQLHLQQNFLLLNQMQYMLENDK